MLTASWGLLQAQSEERVLQGPLPLLPTGLWNVDLSMNELTGAIPSSYGASGRWPGDFLLAWGFAAPVPGLQPTNDTPSQHAR